MKSFSWHFFTAYYFLIGSGESINVTILHTNDVHARFESYNSQSKTCTEIDKKNGHCYGGAARRMTAVKKFRKEYKNVLLLDGGDQFQGTLWYTALKWEPIAAYMNAINYTAMAFGNHEFDDGEEGLESFIRNLNFPVVNSNIECLRNWNEKSLLEGLFKKYHTVNVDGHTIAIIGYTSQETSALSKPSPYLNFTDEIESLKNITAELQKKGINKIIAIGHSGITMDRRICQEVKGVDIVIGGHTNTFLYTGVPPTGNDPIVEGPYPEVYTSTGSNCLVVQDYAYGKYLGFLQVTFEDFEGVVISWNGNPILINMTFVEDPLITELLRPYKAKIEIKEKTIVGKTAVALDGKTCRLQECNMGNMVTDAILYFYTHNINNKGSTSLPNVAILNGGGIREFSSEANVNLTLSDFYTIMPFGNTIEQIQIEGVHLLEAFEHSVKDYDTAEKHGKFLQMSGVRITYNLNESNGNRVKEVTLRCGTECNSVTRYEPLDKNKIYNVVTISYLKNGGDGYNMISENVIRSDSAEILDVDAVLDYFKKHQPMNVTVEGRIRFENQEWTSNGSYCTKIMFYVIFYVTIFNAIV